MTTRVERPCQFHVALVPGYTDRCGDESIDGMLCEKHKGAKCVSCDETTGLHECGEIVEGKPCKKIVCKGCGHYHFASPHRKTDPHMPLSQMQALEELVIRDAASIAHGPT